MINSHNLKGWLLEDSNSLTYPNENVVNKYVKFQDILATVERNSKIKKRLRKF